MAAKSAIVGMNHESQGRLLKDILGALENQFFDIDSFKDLKKYERGN